MERERFYQMVFIQHTWISKNKQLLRLLSDAVKDRLEGDNGGDFGVAPVRWVAAIGPTFNSHQKESF